MTTFEAASPREIRFDSTRARNIGIYLRAHSLSITVVMGLVLVCAVVTSWNLSGYPVRFKDEGVYIAQAWAIPNLHALANYTYWYDHPPGGWLQMAGWMQFTGGFERWKSDTTIAGREFSVVLRIVTCVLLFVLARRLHMRRAWAAFGVLFFILSPLSMYYGRLALLDNIALPWLLGSFVLAMTPRRQLWAVAGSAACLSVAILSKETTVLLAPAVFIALWLNFRQANNKKYAYLFFIGLVGLLPCLYVAYAVVKSELIPGPGHVSLIGALQWQLSGRAGSGSVFDTTSDARNLVNGWLTLDKWLPICGVVSLVILAPVKKYWPVSLALLIQLLMMLRTGYLPSMYIITLLPFMALLVAGAGDTLWPRVTEIARHWKDSDHETKPIKKTAVAVLLAGVVVVCSLSVYSYAHLDWKYTLQNQLTADADGSQREAVNWIGDHVPTDATIVSEGEFWLDLHNRGFTGDGNVWVYKVDTDPAVTKGIRDRGGIDYLALSETTLISESAKTLPIVFAAIDRSDRIAEFGEGGDKMIVMKVRK